MPRYVAFLRGINVGGRKVKKEKLQEIFSLMGFRNVVTYKQSGNVIFEADAGDVDDIKNNIESKLQAELGYNVPVFIRTITQLKETIEKASLKDQDKDGTSFLVTFLSNAPEKFPLPLPATIPKSTAQVISASDREVFSLTHGGGEGALPNPFVESKLKVKATTRNVNTIGEIVKKFSA